MNFFQQNKYQIIFSLLIGTYIAYSFIVYFTGHGKYSALSNERALAGQITWQQNNCQACHQIYGLGGFMGPDLTNIASTKNKGIEYARLIIISGTIRMPRFNLKPEEVENLLAFLKHIDESGQSIVMPENIDIFGNYSIAENRHE